MVEPAKKSKRILSEEAKKRKRESDRTRARTRINIGPAYDQWRELKNARGCKTDGEVASLLLKSYWNFHKAGLKERIAEFFEGPIKAEPETDTETDKREISHHTLFGWDKQEYIEVPIKTEPETNTETDKREISHHTLFGWDKQEYIEVPIKTETNTETG